MKTQPHSPEIGLWLKLSRAEGVGSIIFARLMDQFGSPQAIMGVSVSQLTKISGIGTKTAESIARTRNNFDAEAELALAEKMGVWIINSSDSRYLAALKRL